MEANRGYRNEGKEQRRGGGIYAAVSLLFTLIGVGGLCLGYFLKDSSVGHLVAGGAPIWGGSFTGAVVEVFQGSISFPTVSQGKGLSGYLSLSLYFMILFLTAMLIISLFMTLTSLFKPALARRLCRQNGKLLALSYGLLFSGNFLYHALTEQILSTDFFDLTTAAAAGAELFVLVLLSLAENRWKGIIDFLLGALSLFSLLALAVPEAPLTKALNDIVYINGSSLEVRIAIIVLCGVMMCNLLISLMRLTAGRGYVFDALRFGLQLISAAAVTYLAAEGNLVNFFSSQPLSAVLLLACPLCAFALSIITAGRKQKKSYPDPAKKPMLLLPAAFENDEMPHTA